MTSLSPDTQNFNRFLVSVGMIAIVIAVIAPWFFYRDTAVLMLTREKLMTLTAAARQALMDRQQVVETVQSVLPLAAGVFFVGGAGLLGWGGKRMKEAQSWEDRGLRAQTKQQEAIIVPQSPAERAERHQEADVEEIVARVPADVARDSEGSTPDPPVPTEERPPPGPAIAALPDLSDRLRIAQTIERDVLRHLAKAPPPGYRFIAEPKVTSPSGMRVLLDGLLQALDDSYADIVIEVKVQTSAMVLPPRVDADQLIAASARYRTVTGRRCEGWLIMVYAGPDAGWSRFRDQSQRGLQKSLGPFGQATIVQQADVTEIALPTNPISGLGF